MIALALLWVALSFHALRWLLVRLDEQGALATSTVSMIAAGAFFVAHALRRPRAWTLPSRARQLVLIAATAIIVLHERLLALQTIAWIAFVAGAFVIVAAGSEGTAWERKLGLIATLLVLSLPAVEHLETYFGFAVRALTADVVAGVLRSAGVSAASGPAVIVLENGIADVAEACSGMKTLWTGAIGFVWALALQKRIVLGARTWLLFAGTLLTLLLANAARVLTLVALDHVLDLKEVAKIAHTPLGLFAFVVIIGGAFVLLGRATTPTIEPAPRLMRRGSAWRLASLVAFAFVLRPMLAPQPAHALPLPVEPRFPGATPLALDSKEKALFTSHHARAFKWQLTHEGRLATIVVVVSESFRAHHAPEVCSAAHGHRVDRLRSEPFSDGLTVKTYAIDSGAHRGLYWFESATEHTDSLFSRSLVPLRSERWALVSLVIAGDALPSAALVERVRAVVHPLVQ